MKSLIKASLLLVAILVGLSCSSNDSKNKEINSEVCSRINLDDGDKKSVYDLFSTIDLIPLETTTNSLLGRIDKILINDSIIYIYDGKLSDIFLFNLKGEFIKRINKKGNGPGEYIRILDFNINRFTGNLEVLAGSKILIYNSVTTEYIYTINSPDYYIESFRNVSSDIDVFFFDSAIGNKALKFYSRTMNKIVGETWQIPKALHASGFVGHDPFYLYNDTVRFFKGYSGEVYFVTPTEPYLTLYHSWDFGKYNFDVDQVLENQDYKYYIDLYMKGSMNQALGFTHCCENEKYYITRFRFKNKNQILFYDKINKKQILTDKYKEGMEGHFHVVNNEYLYCAIDNESYNRFINIDILNEHDKKILSSLTEECNPMLLRFKFK